MDERTQIVEWLRAQSTYGDDLTARLIARLADDVEAGGESIRSLLPIADLPHTSAPSLRVLGAAHRLAIRGDAPAYAAHLPTCGGDGDEEGAWLALRDLCASGVLAGEVTQAVQTNEPRRCAALLPGFGVIAEETGLPLRLLEIGSSSGLLLRFDRFRYDISGRTWGEPSSPVCIAATGDQPLLPVAVASRAGCDPNPLDPVLDRDLLLGFIWPDQVDRFGVVAAALDVAAAVPVEIERAAAQDWLPRQLAAPVPGVATVVFHSIVMQYLPSADRRCVFDTIRRAGARATDEAPLAWLSFEPHLPDPPSGAELGLTIWPGGERRALALCGYHGDPVRWGAVPGSSSRS
jgi:hypothetical protein